MHTFLFLTPALLIQNKCIQSFHIKIKCTGALSVIEVKSFLFNMNSKQNNVTTQTLDIVKLEKKAWFTFLICTLLGDGGLGFTTRHHRCKKVIKKIKKTLLPLQRV